MYDKIMYMPFDEREQSILSAKLEYGDAGTQQNNAKFTEHELAKGKTAAAVWYKGRRSTKLAGMSGGQIYIRGHGMPGQNTIEGGRGGESVRYDEVVKRMIKSGLKKTFSGKIKCYNCHSAETTSMEGNMDGRVIETNGMPFAQLIADEFYAAGYKNCTFFGYIGSLDSFTKDGSQGTHRYRRATVFENGKMKQVEMGRMSENRFQFYPVPVPRKPVGLQKLFGRT